MKKIFLLISIGFTVSANAQTHKLEKLWETDTIIAIPESILPDHKKRFLYVSLINGASWTADGVGGIAKLHYGGIRYDSTWITGLNAPKGMARKNDKLYVADISEVVVIDLKKGKIKRRDKIEGATGLNDVTMGPNGSRYVSDSKQGKIWHMKGDVITLYLDSMNGVNGIKSIGEGLFIGAGKSFVWADKEKKISKIAELPQNIDGIEPVGNGDFILTSWAGYIFYVSASGQVETLLDSHDQKMNTADIGYDAKERILFVPTFNAKKVVAYRLK